MDKKLEHLKESLDHTFFKGLEFSEEQKKRVLRSLKTERRRNWYKWLPKLTSIKAAWSVLACLVLLIGSLYFSFSVIKDKVQREIVRSGHSISSSFGQNKEQTYIIYFDAPKDFSDIASLEKHVPIKLKALKYTFPLAHRLPEAGTYILKENEPITVAATNAENQLKTTLNKDIFALSDKVNSIKTEKQLSFERPMLNDCINLLELKKGLLQKVERESITFSSIVVAIDAGWMDKLKNIEGIAGVEPFVPNHSPLDEPYPTDKVFANDKNGNWPIEHINTVADTENDDLWAYSNFSLFRSKDFGVHWNVMDTLNIGNGNIINGAFVDEQYIKLYVKDNGEAFIYSSGDNGKSWTKEGTPFNGNGQMFYLNHLKGWYLEEVGLYNSQAFNRLYKTNDGGENWNLIASSDKPSNENGIPISGVKTNIVFIDDQNGWMTAVEPGGNADLYQTMDGGKTWKNVFFNPPRAFGKTQDSIKGPYFYDSENGFFVLNARNLNDGNSSFVFYKTKNGGKTWQMTQPMDYPYSQEVCVDITTDKVFVTDGKTLYETKDMGETWEKNGMAFDGQTNRVVEPISLNMIDDQHSVLLIREMSNLTRTLFSIGETPHYQSVNVPSIDNSYE